MKKLFNLNINIATGSCGENVKYCLNTSGTLTIFGTGDMSSWAVQQAPWFSKRFEVKQVVIENSVTNIGDFAFENCTNLTSITIPDSVTSIGNFALNNCTNLTSVSLRNSVTHIGNGAFSDCSSLTRITIPDSVTTIGDSAFEGCENLTTVTIPNSVITIGYGAFRCCENLISISLGGGVSTIGSHAFLHCENLMDVYYNGTDIEWDAISIGSCNIPLKSAMRHYVLKAMETRDTCGKGLTWTLDDQGTLTISGIGNMDKWYYGSLAPWNANRSNIKKVIIGDGVTSIGHSAFVAYPNLTTVTISNSVTTIGNGAFWSCKNLTSVTIGDKVVAISSCAFAQCTSLTSITIPDSVIFIGKNAFDSCDNLTNVTLGNMVNYIGENAFRDCHSLTDIYYHGGKEDWFYIEIDPSNDPLEAASKHFNDIAQHAEVVRVSKSLYDIALETAIKNGFEQTFTGSCGVDFQRKDITLSIEKQEDSSVFIKGRKRPRYFGSKINNEIELKSFFEDLMGGDLND